MIDAEMMEQFKLVVDSVGHMLQNSEERMTKKIEESEERMTQKMETMIQESEERMTQKMETMIQESEERMTEKIQESEERMTAKIQESEERMAEKIHESEHNMRLYMELNLERRIDALFDGYKLAHEKQWELQHEAQRLKGQVDSLETRVALLEKKQSA